MMLNKTNDVARGVCSFCKEIVDFPCRNIDEVQQTARALYRCETAFARHNAFAAAQIAIGTPAGTSARGPLTGTPLDNTPCRAGEPIGTGTVKSWPHHVSKVSGEKFDDGKLRYDLVPWDAVAETCAVWTYGALKYDDRNWELGMDRARLRAAATRHRAARLLGEDYDPETGLLHLAHEAANVLMELALFIRNTGSDTGSLPPSHVLGFIKQQGEQAVKAGRAARAVREGRING